MAEQEAVFTGCQNHISNSEGISWLLQPRSSANLEAYPTVVSAKIQTHGQDICPQLQHNQWVCLVQHCRAKPFRRLEDLQRHYHRVHRAGPPKTHPCDYHLCPRAARPFGRRDHFRTHLQSVHKEDMGRPRLDTNDASLRGRKMHRQWWRCSACLVRVDMDIRVCPYGQAH